MVKKFLPLFLLFIAISAFSQQEQPAATDAAAAEAPKPVVVLPDQVSHGNIDGIPVSLTTDDGITLGALFRAAADKKDDDDSYSPKYAILLHDLGKNRSSFSKFTAALTSRGIGFLALDLRGHGRSAGQGHYSKFMREGANNEFNRMYKDVNAAVEYLKNRGIKAENIFVVGAGLGANVAATSMIFNTDIGGFAFLSPTTNTRDVLTMPSIKLGKKPIFIAAAPDVRKLFLEASLIRNAAFTAQGPGKITFVTAYNKEGTEMLDLYLSGHLVQWFLTPALPPIEDDSIVAEINALPEEGQALEVPSVL